MIHAVEGSCVNDKNKTLYRYAVSMSCSTSMCQRMYFCDLPCCSAAPASSGLNAAVGAAKLACFQITDKLLVGPFRVYHWT